MIKKEKIKTLEERIGYSFSSSDLILAALLYPQTRIQSAVREYSFQRLEFLGDRILGLILSAYLFKTYPKEAEGSLAKRLADLASRQTCLRVAKDIQLETYAHGSRVALRDERSMALAHMVEAIVAAVYLDSNIETASDFVLKLWDPYICLDTLPPQDCKSLLQEFLQKNFGVLPIYRILEIEGPAHKPHFRVEVGMEGNEEKAFGTGGNKREAEQMAAKELLRMLSAAP
jgi:ribonuclease-3